MLDSPVSIWNYTHTIQIVVPILRAGFSAELCARCPSTTIHATSMSVANHEAEVAVALLRHYYPVIRDERTKRPAPPAFVDGVGDHPFMRLDLVPLLAPLVPALPILFNTHQSLAPIKAVLNALDVAAPEVLAALGLARDHAGEWQRTVAALHFIQRLLVSSGEVIHATAQPAGTLRETMTAADLSAYWLRIRVVTFGPAPTHQGMCWYPLGATLPIWIAMLVACLDQPTFTRDETSNTISRVLPAWPLRRREAITRLDLNALAHWPISACVLPNEQDGDQLLHLSSVNGVSKLCCTLEARGWSQPAIVQLWHDCKALAKLARNAE